jgi:hypothetical protein
MLPFFSIAKNTFRECLRQPIFIILLLTTCFIVLLYPMMSLFVFREQVKLVTDGSLATIMGLGWVTAVLCASYSISREIETGTVSLILSKPVNRSTFLTAKVCGILGVLTIFVWITGICTLLAVRIAADQFNLDNRVMGAAFGAIALACIFGAGCNYFTKASFSANTVIAALVLFPILVIVVYFLPHYERRRPPDWAKPGKYDPNIISAIVMILFAVWAMGALAIALSTRFDMVSNLTICFIVFILGLMSDYIYLKITELSRAQVLAALHSWYYVILPFVCFFWFLAAKQFHLRKNRKLNRKVIHITFACCLALLIGRGVHDHVNKRNLDLATPMMEKVAPAVHTTINLAAETAHGILPNWQLFWNADALAAGKTIPQSYILFGIAYIVLFITLFLTLAYIMFAFREVGSHMAR